MDKMADDSRIARPLEFYRQFIEIAAPKTEHPKRGYIVPNVELSPMCSAMFKPGPPGDQAQCLSVFTDQHVWVLYCDLVCLNYDGNLTDTCVLALLAALKNTRLPLVTWNEEDESLATEEKGNTPVTIKHCPVSSTFAVFDNHVLLVDPTKEEEDLSTGEVTVVTADDQLCMVRKPGGSPLNAGQLADCIDRAFSRNKEVARLMNETLNRVDR
ncbi:EXOS8-like protein [Mya arenaria]|uniref:Ribosomal RNA-processing protein 43 n=1 Tax=Mya arenaria TaxID=6604 RepID=A0ABY7DQK0_MYAAR|nr:EXOS8-like protein [Mya arenaria]